ncbi:MAG: hypothetical protein CVV07_10065 [Gammaproteobacteria bacterium HGW-Gammaproteobacteria-11]|nr:MAG: hypothetical protein CVV07_10065 [Gammaproteobacteria bacterium HGW-Gammaproteobacteria-11]
MSTSTVTGFFPESQVISSLPEISLTRLQSAIHGKGSLAEQHNAFTDYCLALLFCCTGHRGVKDPFSELKHFDFDRGLLLICDKVSDESRAWRLVSLPDTAVEQVSVYCNYLRLLASQLEGGSPLGELSALIWDVSQGNARIPFFFYLQESCNGWEPVTPATLSKRWQDRWTLPVNFLRHVMADTLLHLTRRADWVSIQLGHADGVDHPFGATSTKPALDTLGQIRPYLEEGLKKIGWTVARSPLHGSRIRHRPVKRSWLNTSSEALFGYQRREAVRKGKRSIAATFFRELWSEQFPTGAALNRTAVQRIVEQIIIQAQTRGHSVNWCLRLLYSHLRSRPGGLAILRQIARYRQIEMEPTPFHAGSLTDYQAGQCIRAAYLGYLEQQGKNEASLDVHVRFAEIVVSAAIFSGIANADRLKVLGSALLTQTYLLKRSVFVDVPLGHGAVFRWFPDQVSQKLIYGLFRAETAGQKIQENKTRKALNSLVCELVGSAGGCPYDRLVRISRAVSGIEMPGYISSCLSGVIPAVSLPLPQWVRVVTGKSLTSGGEPAANQPDKSDNWTPVIKNSKRQHTAGEGRAFLREFRRLISAARNTKRTGNQLARTRSKRELVKTLQLACESSGWSALQMMLAGWTVHLCRHGTRSKKVLAYSTVEKYSVLVASRLVPVSVNLDVYALDEVAYEEMYLRAVEREEPKRRFELACRLREIHAFFQDVYLMEDLDWSAIMGAAGGPAQTRFAEANIITSAEYRRALTALVDDVSLGERRRWQYAGLLLLGFRFNLRFGEALRLRFTDVQRDGEQVYVWVHNSIFAETKSHAGVRVVPLIERLDALETRVLDRLLAAGEFDFDDNPAAMLMAEHSGAAELIDLAEAGRVLNGLLRRVTGDSSSRFHHLRHGWATRAVASHIGLVTPGFYEQLSEAVWPEFYGSDAGFPLRSIAVAAGHANESTTLGSYTHCADQMVSDYLPEPQLSDHTVAYAEQIAYATVRTRRRGSRRASEGRLPAIPKPAIATRTPQVATLSGLICQSLETGPPSLTDVDMLLRRLRNSVQSVDVVARTLGLNIQASRRAVDRALSLEVRTGYDGYRLATRSDDFLAWAVSDRKARQFKREDDNVIERLRVLDRQIRMSSPPELDEILSGLRALEETVDAKSGDYYVVRVEQLSSIAKLAALLDARVSAAVSALINTCALRELLQVHGVEWRYWNTRRAGLRLSLTPASGPKRTLQRLLLIIAVAIPDKYQTVAVADIKSDDSAAGSAVS